MDYKIIAENLVSNCLKKGADAAEIYIESNRELSIELRNGDIETVQEATSHGAGFRVFVEGKMAFSHCNDFSDEALDDAISRAVDFAGNTTPDENNVLPEDELITEVEGLYDPEIAEISMDKKIELAKKVESLAMEDVRITKSSGAGFSEGESEIIIGNSNGLLKNYRSTYCSFGVGVVAEKEDQKSSGYEYCSRRFFSDLKPPEEVAIKAAKDAYEMLDPRMVKTQKAAVVFDPDVARSILGGIIGALNGERVLQGASFLADKLEEKFASELMTLIDDGTRSRGLGSKPFDGEGVPTQRRVLVDAGVLKGFLYNTAVGKRAGIKSTGNASRGGFTSLPGIGFHNLFMAAGASKKEEIIESTSNGLLLKGVTGYGINSVNGNFSGGASGFWIENGKISFPVKGLTIAGSAFDILNAIDMVADDLDLNLRFTAPTFRISEMQIGGEG
ncbi:MAG: TldD/PmbA family protein [Bacteroidales bacterium]|nr:MAG: TldD/PmbA family protein [Bacteroidales bacterium]